MLCIGQAGGRSQLTPEFVGINYAQARIPDNEGNQPLNEPLVPARRTLISRSCRSMRWWRRSRRRGFLRRFPTRPAPMCATR
ncbi:MAG: hypothetical protein V8T10_03175 [Merdibacter sp.]